MGKPFPVMIEPDTKKKLAEFRHDNEQKIINLGGRRYASWDKTIQYLLSIAKRVK